MLWCVVCVDVRLGERVDPSDSPTFRLPRNPARSPLAIRAGTGAGAGAGAYAGSSSSSNSHHKDAGQSGARAQAGAGAGAGARAGRECGKQVTLSERYVVGDVVFYSSSPGLRVEGASGKSRLSVGRIVEFLR